MALYVHRRSILLLPVFITFCAVAMGLHHETGSEDAHTNCVTPDAILDAQLMSDNGSFSVNFSWTFAPLENENNTICHHVFSVRSFQLFIPFEFEDKTEPIGYDGIRYSQVNQQTYHIFVDIDTATYYQFELRIQTGLDTGSTRYYKHFSYIYYFGDQAPARVTEPVSNHTVIRTYIGDSVTLPCSGTGTPFLVNWVLRDPNGYPPYCDYCHLDKGDYIDEVSEYDSGEYFCVAYNTLVNPPLGKRETRDWKRIELIIEPAPANFSYSRCRYYFRSVCGAFLDDELPMFVDDIRVPVYESEEQLQKQALNLFRRINRRANRNEVISNLDPALRSKCHRLAKFIACHSIYPYCGSDHQVPTPRLVCRTTCDAFAPGGVCERFIGDKETPELYARLATKCDSREHPAGSSPECIPVSLETAEIDHYSLAEHSWCTWGNGRNYAGDIRRTRSGLDCQSWGSQVPHKHPFWPSKYSSELNNNTYACRNPEGVGEGPWCYTSDPNVRWEYCEVPQCEVCQQYEGYGFCRSIEGYGDGNWTVYVNRSQSKWGPLGLGSVDQFLESLLSQLIVNGDDTWTPGCEHAVRQLLCHATLPFCKKQEVAAPLMVCGGCQLLDTIQFCSTVMYSRLVVQLEKQSSRFYFQPDDCLARAAGSNFSGPDCMPPPQGLPSGPDECYSSSDHGQSYTGQLATTQGGKHCQSWDEPHLLFHPQLYSELDDAANLCRNPGQLKDRIWCFISESAWDYCSIPTNCTTSLASAQFAYYWMIVIPTILAVFVMTCLFITGNSAFFCCFSGRNLNRRAAKQSLHLRVYNSKPCNSCNN